jgi:hypothetical protein
MSKGRGSWPDLMRPYRAAFSIKVGRDIAATDRSAAAPQTLFAVLPGVRVAPAFSR